MKQQMRILGVDFGLRKIGLATGEGLLANPYKILKYEDIKILREKIKRLVEKEKIEKVVVGISEGKMAENSKEFGKKLQEVLKIPVEFFDETLSTHDAIRLSKEAGIKSKKRKELEDAFSATLILQRYLDETEFDK